MPPLTGPGMREDDPLVILSDDGPMQCVLPASARLFWREICPSRPTRLLDDTAPCVSPGGVLNERRLVSRPQGSWVYPAHRWAVRFLPHVENMAAGSYGVPPRCAQSRTLWEWCIAPSMCFVALHHIRRATISQRDWACTAHIVTICPSGWRHHFLALPRCTHCPLSLPVARRVHYGDLRRLVSYT
jgi:hypothetical protein